MGETLKIRAATLVHDGETYNLNQGPIPDDTPSAVVDKLRDEGALAGPEDVVVPIATGAPDPNEPLQVEPPGGRDTTAAPAVPDINDTATLAGYIDDQNLNASETVALAGDDPSNAQAVIDAENTAHGGDGRKTVVEPLERLRDSGGG